MSGIPRKKLAALGTCEVCPIVAKPATWSKLWFIKHLKCYESMLCRDYCRSILAISLTHWVRVTHICVSRLTIIGSDNGLTPDRRQAIIWTNAGIFLIGPVGTNFNEILIKIYTFSFRKMHLKMSSGKWRPFCLGLNVLRVTLLALGRWWDCPRATETTHDDALVQEKLTPLLTHWSSVFLALTQRMVYESIVS